MLTQEEKTIKVLEQVPFVPASQTKIAEALKGIVTDAELFLILSALVAEGKVKMAMGQRGPEFSRDWNKAIDEERKNVSRELNKRFDENTIFYPRFDGYVANLEDNFLGDNYADVVATFGTFDKEYSHWHKNAKSGVIYPPKMHALNSKAVLATNVVAGLGLAPEQVEYAVEFEVIEPEALKERPDEMSSPKAQFDAIIHYEDGFDFVQTNFLEPFYQPFRQSMWAYQYGDRYLFNDEEATRIFRDFAKKANFVFFDGYQTFKTIVAIYSDILANPEGYTGKKVNLLNMNWDLGNESAYQAMKEFQNDYLAEGRRVEGLFNELLASLPLPEGTTFEFQFLTLSEVVENMEENAKEYLTKRYLNF